MKAAATGRWALLLMAAACDPPAPPPIRAVRDDIVAPAAHGAIGAYAKSGQTPWTERPAPEVNELRSPGEPSPPAVRGSPESGDGGITL